MQVQKPLLVAATSSWWPQPQLEQILNTGSKGVGPPQPRAPVLTAPSKTTKVQSYLSRTSVECIHAVLAALIAHWQTDMPLQMDCLLQRCPLTTTPFAICKGQNRRTRCNRTSCLAKHAAYQRQTAPLLHAVLERGNRLQDKPFHVPGHKVAYHWLLSLSKISQLL